MFKKFAALAAAAALSLGIMTGCGASGTTADSTGYSAENPLVLTLAHGLSETHTVHIAMTQFADEVAEKTDGRIQVKIFPNGQLGSENENLEQLQAGVIAMTKVSAPGLATYNDAFNTFGLPYIFNDTDDFYHVMDSQEMQDFFFSCTKYILSKSVLWYFNRLTETTEFRISGKCCFGMPRHVNFRNDGYVSFAGIFDNFLYLFLCIKSLLFFSFSYRASYLCKTRILFDFDSPT